MKYSLHVFPADYSDCMYLQCETARKALSMLEFAEELGYRYLFFRNGVLLFTDETKGEFFKDGEKMEVEPES